MTRLKMPSRSVMLATIAWIAAIASGIGGQMWLRKSAMSRGETIGDIGILRGEAQVRSTDLPIWVPLTEGKVHDGEIIATGGQSRARITLVDGRRITLGPNTQVALSKNPRDPAVRIAMIDVGDVTIDTVPAGDRARGRPFYVRTRGGEIRVKSPEARVRLQVPAHGPASVRVEVGEVELIDLARRSKILKAGAPHPIGVEPTIAARPRGMRAAAIAPPPPPVAPQVAPKAAVAPAEAPKPPVAKPASPKPGDVAPPKSGAVAVEWPTSGAALWATRTDASLSVPLRGVAGESVPSVRLGSSTLSAPAARFDAKGQAVVVVGAAALRKAPRTLDGQMRTVRLELAGATTRHEIQVGWLGDLVGRPLGVRLKKDKKGDSGGWLAQTSRVSLGAADFVHFVKAPGEAKLASLLEGTAFAFDAGGKLPASGEFCVAGLKIVVGGSLDTYLPAIRSLVGADLCFRGAAASHVSSGSVRAAIAAILADKDLAAQGHVYAAIRGALVKLDLQLLKRNDLATMLLADSAKAFFRQPIELLP